MKQADFANQVMQVMKELISLTDETLFKFLRYDIIMTIVWTGARLFGAIEFRDM
jgi:hypothetical protein